MRLSHCYGSGSHWSVTAGLVDVRGQVGLSCRLNWEQVGWVRCSAVYVWHLALPRLSTACHGIEMCGPVQLFEGPRCPCCCVLPCPAAPVTATHGEQQVQACMSAPACGVVYLAQVSTVVPSSVTINTAKGGCVYCSTCACGGWPLAPARLLKHAMW